MSEAGKRLFIGLSLAESHKDEIEPIVKKLKTTGDKKEIQMRWAPKANWHITLAFLGLTANNKVGELKEILKKFAGTQTPLEIHLRNLGGFPEVFEARVLWIGVAASKKLMDLQKRLEVELYPWGYKGEERAYSPHLTIARLRNQKNINDLISPWVRKDFGKMKVGEITLFESKPAGYFSRYEPMETFALSRENTGVPQEMEEDNT